MKEEKIIIITVHEDKIGCNVNNLTDYEVLGLLQMHVKIVEMELLKKVNT